METTTDERLIRAAAGARSRHIEACAITGDEPDPIEARRLFGLYLRGTA